MNDIKITDKFFDENDIAKFFEIIANSAYDNCCLERSFQNRYGATSYFQYSIMDFPFITEYCKNLFYNKLVKTNFRILRCNILRQAYGQSGTFHVDHEKFDALTEYKNGQNINTLQFTIMVYVNDVNCQEPTSSIIFKTDNKHLIEVEVIHNRVVMFPAYYYHMPTCSTSRDIRTAITFKCEYIG